MRTAERASKTKMPLDFLPNLGFISFHPVPLKGRFMSVVRRGAGSGGRVAGGRNLLRGRFKPRPAVLAAGVSVEERPPGTMEQTVKHRARNAERSAFPWCYQSHALYTLRMGPWAG
jgi:hypothetical protein